MILTNETSQFLPCDCLLITFSYLKLLSFLLPVFLEMAPQYTTNFVESDGGRGVLQNAECSVCLRIVTQKACLFAGFFFLES